MKKNLWDKTKRRSRDMQGIITPPCTAESKCRRVSQTETLRYRL